MDLTATNDGGGVADWAAALVNAWFRDAEARVVVRIRCVSSAMDFSSAIDLWRCWSASAASLVV